MSYTISYGVSPSRAFVSDLFLTYVAVLNAFARRDLGRRESCSIARTAFVRTPVVRSATPFEAGCYGTVVLSLPASSQIRHISPCDNSLALSVSTPRTFFPDSVSATALKTLKASAASDFSRSGLVYTRQE